MTSFEIVLLSELVTVYDGEDLHRLLEDSFAYRAQHCPVSYCSVRFVSKKGKWRFGGLLFAACMFSRTCKSREVCC